MSESTKFSTLGCSFNVTYVVLRKLACQFFGNRDSSLPAPVYESIGVIYSFRDSSYDLSRYGSPDITCDGNDQTADNVMVDTSITAAVKNQLA
jgi:hypothetical protein